MVAVFGLDVENSSKDAGARIIQASRSGGTSQQWRLEDTRDGYYRLVNVNSDKVVNVAGSSLDNMAAVVQWNRGSGLNERFIIPWQERTFAVRRPWDAGCNAGETLTAGLCYDIEPGWAVTTPGIVGKVCSYDWRDDGTNCWPAWSGVKVGGQADPNGDVTQRHPICRHQLSELRRRQVVPGQFPKGRVLLPGASGK